MILFLWWLSSILFFLLGSWLVVWRSQQQVPEIFSTPPISVLKPLKGRDEGLYRNLESFFLQDYPQYELLFSIASPWDPARVVVEELQRKYPQVRAQLIIGDEELLNPKVANLVRSYHEASHDLLVISDSNVRVSCSYLGRMAAQMNERVGVLTAIVAGISGRGIGGALEATYLNTFYARGLCLAFLFGKPCVIGKSMMFRKSVAEKFGGMHALGQYVAEDYVIGEKMRGLGLQIKLMLDPVEQYIGRYSFSSFWQRHLRWGRIRKVHAPLAFFLEPLFMPLFSSVGGALVLHRWVNLSTSLVFCLSLLLFGICDYITATQVSKRKSPRFAIGWLLRELLSFPLWLVTASSNKVQWRGHSLSLCFGGEIKQEAIECPSIPGQLSSGVPQPARTKLRATITEAIGSNGIVTAKSEVLAGFTFR
jgi:ceramide glucosyltransferase